MRKRRHRRIRTALAILFIAGAVVFFAVSASIVFDSTIDETRQADAAIVLGAQIGGDAPSPVFEERIRHGIDLYQSRTVRCLIFTGGRSAGDEWSEAAVAKKYAMERGVPERDIYIEELSGITEENMIHAKDLMEEHSIGDALIVSDPLHMKRAMQIADDSGIEAYASPTPTTRYRSFFPKMKFLMRETALLIGYGVVKLFRAE